MPPEKIYDALLAAKTAECGTIVFKDGRSAKGAIIFNPLKGTGRVIDADKEYSVNFNISDVGQVRY